MVDSFYTPYHAKYFAHFLTREGLGENEGLSQSLSAARVDLNPHQVDAALFAMRSPLSRGVILADEVGLGKTIEAALVISQRWWERQRKLLLICPASLRKQWATELREKFSLPSRILDAKRVKELRKEGATDPFGSGDAIIIMSYEYAARAVAELRGIRWDMVVFDEAHKLRNVYRAAANSRAAVLKTALADSQKILLTATPLQNNLMELYGLISVIDDKYFGSEAAFRAEFAKADRSDLLRLGSRLEPICKRTLRRQVQKAGLINYTDRNLKTFNFEPHQLEVDLYEKMSDYLIDPNTVGIGQNGRHLVTLVMRKILGSSSFAIAATLEKMVRRLETRLTVAEDDLDDIEGVSETAAEWEEDAPDSSLEAEAEAVADNIELEILKGEIETLRRYRDLASSISTNAKGTALLNNLSNVMDVIVAKGGQRKAVIFTESVRTQTYLRDLLEQNGFAGETVLLNGSNSDPQSQALYKNWFERHKGTDVVSASKSADMKAAIVDAFKRDKAILIATESGAEGINLQFCSLLINYDLPWNPQRVEQRIGRCHRYGQRIDVTVVNFLNTRNHAEARIAQLLASKFQLFEGVFGSSDDVLGAIESGVDIEKRILQIVQSCRTNDEIDAAFNQLQADLDVQISEAKKQARDQLLAQMDDKVVQQLKLHKTHIVQSLDEFKQSLLMLARAELTEARFHPDHAERFDLHDKTYTTEWPIADESGWHFYRLGDEDGNLANRLVQAARDRDLPSAALSFDLSLYGGVLSDLNAYVGSGGWMKLSRLKLITPAKVYDELIVAAIKDDGTALDPETSQRFMKVPATVVKSAITQDPLSVGALAAVTENQRTNLVAKAQENLGAFLEEEERRLELWYQDAKVSYEGEIKALIKEANEKEKLSRAVSSLEQKVELKREAKALKNKADELHHQLYQHLRNVDNQRSEMLDRIAEQLNLTPTLEDLFTVRWTLVKT